MEIAIIVDAKQQSLYQVGCAFDLWTKIRFAD